ncbi:MAG TPA: glycosyltransferase, partial [Rhizomicrobium sp.]|nr:glycosyltransferase [Rhizomicrobium sp.]
MSQLHAAGNVRPYWVHDEEDTCAESADVALYLRRAFLPLRREGDTLLVALADRSAENCYWIRARYGPVCFLGVALTELHAEITQRFEGKLSSEAIFSLARERPELSAQRILTPTQGEGLLAAAVLSALWLVWDPLPALAAVVIAMTVLFIVGTLFRVLLSWFGGLPPEREQGHAGCDDTSLPAYSILIPLYREAKVVPGLLQALARLEYPRGKLDIKLVVEGDDAETTAACEQHLPAGAFEIVSVPPSLPRTKPKALNYALRSARGEYLVVYDAEDRPEPDQLLKSIALFRRLPRSVACLQARLAFHNRDRWLSKSFAIDYFTWFGSLLPGLEKLRVPMPLGGTSNHFRTAVLNEIGA